MEPLSSTFMHQNITSSPLPCTTKIPGRTGGWDASISGRYQQWFNIDNRRLKARRKLDARDTNWNSFVSAAAMANARPIPIRGHECCLRAAQWTRDPPSTYPFQATHEVDQFATDLDQQLVIRCWWLITASNSAPRKKLILWRISQPVPRVQTLAAGIA